MEKRKDYIEDADLLVPKLVSKISSQAAELESLEVRLSQQQSQRGASNNLTNVPANSQGYSYNFQSNYNEILQSPVDIYDEAEPRFLDPSTTSQLSTSTKRNIMNSLQSAQKRSERELNLQIVNLQKKLVTAENRLVEQAKVKNKLLQDLESKSREAKFLEKLCTDKESEIQMLRAKADSKLSSRSSTPTPGTRNLKFNAQRSFSPGEKSALRSRQLNVQGSMDPNDRNIRFQLEQCRKELESSKESEAQMKIKIKVLEDALDFRSEEVGLAGQADLLAKVAKLKGEVTALRNELSDREKKLEEVEDVKLDLSTRHEVLQKQINLMQKRLAQSQQDSYRLAHGVRLILISF